MRLTCCISVAALSLLCAAGAHASELDTLRATLSRMHASAPFAATLDVRNSTSGGDEDQPKTSKAHLKLSVAIGADGLQMGYSKALLQQMAAEMAANAKDPNKATPTVGLLSKVGAMNVKQMLDSAPALLRNLEGAKLTAQRDEVHDGVPTHCLIFSVPAGLDKEGSDAIKHYQGSLKVWLGNDGVPLAVTASRDYQGRKFFISFEYSMSVTSKLKRVGQRLVVVSKHSEVKQSGFGSKSDSVTDVTLTPQTAVATASAASVAMR